MLLFLLKDGGPGGPSEPLISFRFLARYPAKLSDTFRSFPSSNHRAEEGLPSRFSPNRSERWSARMAEINPITVARFWSKVEVAPSDSACWIWNGAKNGNGYGNFRIPQYGRLSYSAHRVAYRLVRGEWPPEGMVVRHKCDNPLCVNPAHLEPGTVSDNMRDMVERGRAAKRDQTGENNGAAKLRAADVDRIRRLIDMGQTNTAIAAQYGVTHSLISRIRRGRSWAA